jgi:serine/threonine-protein kinase
LCGRWRVGELLGRGGMSTVYAATHRNGKACAIKVLHPELAAGSRSRRRFLREGYIANRVAHEGVVSVLDNDVAGDGIVFLVMDLLDGVTLEHYCRGKGGRLPPGDVLVIADAVLDVLIAAHAKGIVHRDLKPSNVFLTSKGALKLLDFGIASLREISPASGSTGTGMVLGTPGFIAPEQARGRWKEIDARTDLWGLGAMIFRLLTGRVVHDGGTTNELVIAAATLDAPPLASIDPSLPLGIAALVDRALRAKPSERWQSAVELQAAVRVELSKIPHGRLPRPEPLDRERPTLDESLSARHTDEGDLAAESEREPTKKAFALRRWPIYVMAAAVVAFVIAVRSGGRKEDPAPRTDSEGVVATAQPSPQLATDPMPEILPDPVASATASSTPSAPPPKRAPAPRGPARPASTASKDTAVGSAAPAGAAPSASWPTKLEDVLDERH